MKSQIFREYDIRGIVEKEFTINETYKLAKAIITYFKTQDSTTNKVVIGRDGRTHSLAIQKNVIRAAQDMGLDVTDIGICPTPAFYFSLFNTNSTSGLIVTASHNPGEYNGMKICQNTKTVWGTQIQEIRKIYESKNFYENKFKKMGSLKKHDIITDYINWLANNFEHLKGLDISAVIDCGNGTAGTVLPKLIEKMNLKNIKLLYPEVDGTFPNHPADPTVMKNMLDTKNELEKNKDLKFGLGLDGDCDRMNPITKDGYLIPGDQLLALYAKQVLKEHPGATIVFDIKASSSLIELLQKWGAIGHICPSGHSLVKEAMLNNDAKLAGELSCHFFFNDRYFGYDDGIYAALRLFEILNETNTDLSKLIKIFPEKNRSPEIRIACLESNKKEIVNTVKNIFAAKKEYNLITIDGIRAETKNGWGLVRASNTQPVICLRFESNTPKELLNIKKDFHSALKPYFDEKELKEQIDL